MRAYQAREGEVDVDTGSNATDDGMIDALQDSPGDLSREEVRKEIMGLNERQQAELVALLWTGRGDAEPEAWEETVEMARDRRDTPTARYLLGHLWPPNIGKKGPSCSALRLGAEAFVSSDDIRSSNGLASISRSARTNHAQHPVGNRTFPVSAGILLGVGLGGFFDGIVLHQLLQWHHMLSSWYPITSELVPAAQHLQRQLDGFLLLSPRVDVDLDAIKATLKLVESIVQSLNLRSRGRIV